jgi:N-acyl-D-aspartate/D-glutamate deacylase
MTARDCTDSSFDLVIRNGLVIDGTGSPGFVADLAIAGGHIAAVGHFPGNGRQEIHAPGLAVTPGFIDIHTHYDGQATWDSMLMPSCLHGVTTIVVGNCGVGFAPARPDRHGWLIDLLEGVEDIPGTALAEGLAWDWETFPDYLDALARRELTVDIAAYVPHAPLRTFVMGNRGGDPAAIASPAEMAEMARLVVEGIAAGAIGFATSRTMVHRSRSGEVVGTYRAPEEELLTIAAAMGRHGKGVLQLISDAYLVAEEDFFDDEFGLIEALCRESGRP